jgi:hypothetical protein
MIVWNATFLFIGLIRHREKWNAKDDQDDHADCQTASPLGYDRRPHASKDRAGIGAIFKASLRALRCHTDLRHEDAERWRLPERIRMDARSDVRLELRDFWIGDADNRHELPPTLLAGDHELWRRAFRYPQVPRRGPRSVRLIGLRGSAALIPVTAPVTAHAHSRGACRRYTTRHPIRDRRSPRGSLTPATPSVANCSPRPL